MATVQNASRKYMRVTSWVDYLTDTLELKKYRSLRRKYTVPQPRWHIAPYRIVQMQWPAVAPRECENESGIPGNLEIEVQCAMQSGKLKRISPVA